MITKEQVIAVAEDVTNKMKRAPISDAEMIKLLVDFYEQVQKCEQCNVSGSLPPLDDEVAGTPIRDALYATRAFTTDDCDSLADGILQYIKDAGFSIVGGNDR